MSRFTFIAIFLVLSVPAALSGFFQSPTSLETFFRQNIGLTQDQIVAIRSGRPVAKALPSRTPAEVFLFGTVYINTASERYVQFAHDFQRLRKLPNYLALDVFSNPPQLSDLKDFSLDSGDIEALKSCKPGDCLVQVPATAIDELHRSINWSAADTGEQLNQLLRRSALQLIFAYQREGNRALGIYNDKREPADVSRQFASMLSYSKVLPERLPDFYNYLLNYPSARPANVEDTFYWARVKFGLKPTVRVVHRLTLRGNPTEPLAYAIAEKQLYASHYFETALDLSFCIRGSGESKQPGFYLITVMGSEQAGLTGVKGSAIRKVAVGRSVSNLENALKTAKSTLEASR